MRRHTIIGIGSLFTVLVAASACGGGSPADGANGADGNGGEDRDAVVVRVVSSHQQNDPVNDMFWRWVEEVEEQAPWVEIEYRGAGEVMEPTQLMEAVSSGAIDMTQSAFAYYTQNIPMVNAMKLTPFTPAEERENGVYDVLTELHEQHNIHFLGRTVANVPFQIYLNEPVDSADLSGMSIRTSPVYVAMLEGLGAAPVAIPPGEIYSAMERGVVDGFGWPSLGITHNSWDEVTNYEIATEFYEADFVALINLDFWNNLDDETRQVFTDAQIAIENELPDYFGGLVDEEQAERRAGGMEVIELSEAESQRLIDVAYEAGWEEVLSEAPEAQELRDLFGN